ncbi:hypothetical protein FPHOBKDP_00080 [Listeria phage LPJP1]|nr:hypothetical protein FPHOBKDP_00080 [Listeria phage LPJP1]
MYINKAVLFLCNFLIKNIEIKSRKNMLRTVMAIFNFEREESILSIYSSDKLFRNLITKVIFNIIITSSLWFLFINEVCFRNNNIYLDLLVSISFSYLTYNISINLFIDQFSEYLDSRNKVDMFIKSKSKVGK